MSNRYGRLIRDDVELKHKLTVITVAVLSVWVWYGMQRWMTQVSPIDCLLA